MPTPPTYTIQQDPPWIPVRTSTAPSTTSFYSEDYHEGMADIAPLQSKPGNRPSYHAHPQQHIKDNGPTNRQSRLPIFKQVRSILHKPPPLTTPSNPKWDEYTGDRDDKNSKLKPPNYVSPYDGAFKANRKPSPDRPNKARKNLSPVSILRDDELTPIDQRTENGPADRSPVSPVSPAQEQVSEEEIIDQSLVPEPLSANVQRNSYLAPRTPPLQPQIKRKPVSRSASSLENHPPAASHHSSPSQSSEMSGEGVTVDKDIDYNQPKSHFSWTTYAPSVAPGRQSIDTMATRQTVEYAEEPQSRFSWSTVATNATQPARAESPPPPLPGKSTEPPVQSILSRRRPVQRAEKEDWIPPPSMARSSDTPRSGTPKDSSTPTSTSTARALQLPTTTTTPTSNTASPSTLTAKALPPPPQLTYANDLTRLEALLAQERDIQLQRTNIEKGIFDLEKIERASPLEVPFATVRDAKKRLAEYRQRLDEVKLEEQEIGIGIARARRREEKEMGGDGETLWVRRVTG